MDGVISGEEPTSHSHKCLRDLFIGRAIELDSPSVELQDNLHDHTPHLIKPTCTKPRDPIQTARSTPPCHWSGPHANHLGVARAAFEGEHILYRSAHPLYACRVLSDSELIKNVKEYRPKSDYFASFPSRRYTPCVCALVFIVSADGRGACRMPSVPIQPMVAQRIARG